MTTATLERRGSVRRPVSGPIWWRGAHTGELRHGWLLDRSRHGLAFMTRGARNPIAGEGIRLYDMDPAIATIPFDVAPAPAPAPGYLGYAVQPGAPSSIPAPHFGAEPGFGVVCRAVRVQSDLWLVAANIARADRSRLPSIEWAELETPL